MPRFTVASLNCDNLFQPGVHLNRGPQTSVGLTTKIVDLARTMRIACPARLPAIMCLSEIGAEQLGRRVSDAVRLRRYQTLWSGSPMPQQTGVIVAYDPRIVQADATADDRATRGARERCKWFAVRFRIRHGSTAPFWLVLNHWKSRMGGEVTTEAARSNSAREIGEFFLTTARNSSEAMVLIGDFNCEPGAAPFVKPANSLRAVRERSTVFRDRNRLAYFYNPMWRLLGEADAYERTCTPGYYAPRPPGTFCPSFGNEGWITLDQIMVSKRLLIGGPIRFVESTLRVTQPLGQCSDHCAIAACFDYT